jgi:hypothetical protein
MHNCYFSIFGNIFVSFLVAFSVDKWKEQKHFKVEKLNEYQVSQLLEETGLGDYLKTTECIVPSSSSKWKNGKIILFLVYNMLIMYNLPLPVTHHMPYNTASSLPPWCPCQHLMCFTTYTHQGWVHQVDPGYSG